MHAALRYIFLGYFASHIPITIIIDGQALFDFYPNDLKSIYSNYCSTYNDVLMTTKPMWLRSFIACELLFQLPFFFAAVYGLAYKKNWLRIPSIIYGAHVATTVVPILAETLFSRFNTFSEKATLFGFYFPYFLIPFLLLVYMAANPVPFPNKKADGKRM